MEVIFSHLIYSTYLELMEQLLFKAIKSTFENDVWFGDHWLRVQKM